MKSKICIQLKATFLLIVFSLNTIIGFACAVGIDMGFNAHETSSDVHNNGKKEVDGSDDKKHHDKAGNDHHKSKKHKDNCCHDKVINFEQLDKSVPNRLSIIHPVFFTIFVASFYNVSLLPHTKAAKNIKQFVQNYHPPIPDICIAIQSFLI